MTRNRIALIALILVALVGFSYYGATNFDRIVLGSGNFGEDPNTTADITGQNDEYISNSTDGTWDMGSANITTTGNVTGLLDLGSTVVGVDTFTTTGTTDTVTISGAAATDVYLITGRLTAGVDQQDVLQWQALSGKLVVHRLASGESALIYSWLRIK